MQSKEIDVVLQTLSRLHSRAGISSETWNILYTNVSSVRGRDDLFINTLQDNDNFMKNLGLNMSFAVKRVAGSDNCFLPQDILGAQNINT